jgi:hypothetical protein
VTKPDQSQVTVALTDDGLNGDSLSGDGVYGGLMTGAIPAGEYRVQYHAEGLNPENNLAFRRFVRGASWIVSSGDGFIASDPQGESVDTNADGLVDYIQVQLMVEVNAPGEYSVSAELADDSGRYRLADSQPVSRTEAGNSMVTLFFDRRGLPAGTAADSFHVENLQLYQSDGQTLIWLDRYRGTYAIQANLYGLPSTDQVAQYVIGNDTMDLGAESLGQALYDINEDGQVDVADVIGNVNEGR